jgi:hypothetical protein
MNKVTPLSRVLIEKLAVAHLVKNYQSYVESEISLPCSREPHLVLNLTFTDP